MKVGACVSVQPKFTATQDTTVRCTHGVCSYGLHLVQHVLLFSDGTEALLVWQGHRRVQA